MGRDSAAGPPHLGPVWGPVDRGGTQPHCLPEGRFSLKTPSCTWLCPSSNCLLELTLQRFALTSVTLGPIFQCGLSLPGDVLGGGGGLSVWDTETKLVLRGVWGVHAQGVAAGPDAGTSTGTLASRATAWSRRKVKRKEIDGSGRGAGEELP
ncbi:hypothetical protein HJG60_009478 [Phyllostomus discolor]|uniref:Uncharacterized protein n=1 Tax=Phyllostomus discolor TaxID=89673 RepID=A0A833YKX1_9CHIR|nr:hypothetical protein HJG60_009478 [Phyllostomus discolor]